MYVTYSPFSLTPQTNNRAKKQNSPHFGDPISARMAPSASAMPSTLNRVVNVSEALGGIKANLARISLGLSHMNKHPEKFKEEIPAKEKEQKIGQIAKANLIIALDESSEEVNASRNNLETLVKSLEDSGYFNNNNQVDPQVVRAYALLGSHTHANDLYRTTKDAVLRGEGLSPEELGQEQAIWDNEVFQPLAIWKWGDNQPSIDAVQKELPFLNKAIKLTESMEGTPAEKQLAKAQYLTLTGEVFHTLAHLYERLNLTPPQITGALPDVNKQKFTEFSEQSRKAFLEAFTVLLKINQSAQAEETEVKEKANHLFKELISRELPHVFEDKDETTGAHLHPNPENQLRLFWKQISQKMANSSSK